MKDIRDIPLPADDLKSKVMVFAITDDTTHQYDEITKGYVELTTDEDQKSHTIHYLEVRDQKSNEVLMRSTLKLSNNFGKQKGSIISWTDDQQPQYQQIALSFQKERQCDMLWRTICEKIGKNYLQINGAQKLQSPNANNLNYYLQKAKNSRDLIDYNIVHSKSILQGLQSVFYEMKKNRDDMGMGTISRIIHTIMSPTYSFNAIQTLLTGSNFYLLLDLEQFKKNINFRQIYQQKVERHLFNVFQLPKDIFEKIELSHRATFYRENVLDLAEDSLLQGIMFMICKEALVEIMSFLNRTKFFQTLLKYCQEPHQLQKGQLNPVQSQSKFKNNINKQQFYERNSNNSLMQQENIDDRANSNEQSLCIRKFQFIQEALIMFHQITSEHIKLTFKQSIYTSGVLKFIHQNLQNSQPKAFELLYCVSQIDKQKFFEYLINDFKDNSSNNLLKTLMNKYITQPPCRKDIIALIQSIAQLFNLKKEYFDFFNGTFVCSVFSVAKDLKGVLNLANTLLHQLENSSLLFEQFIKCKISFKIASQYRSGASLQSKSQQLQILKFLKQIIIEQNSKGILKNKQIEQNIIQSGLFDCCMMIYLKHSQKNNLISSSMLQNLKLIQKMNFSEFDVHLVKQYSGDETLQKIIKPIKLKYIQHINKQIKNATEGFTQLQKIGHAEILENEQQESYLMNQQEDPPTNTSSQKSQISKHKTESQKEDSIQYLKRIMEQITDINQKIDQNIFKQPKKMIKKNQQNQPSIQFCFNLPDIEQFQGEMKST